MAEGRGGQEESVRPQRVRREFQVEEGLSKGGPEIQGPAQIRNTVVQSGSIMPEPTSSRTITTSTG